MRQASTGLFSDGSGDLLQEARRVGILAERDGKPLDETVEADDPADRIEQRMTRIDGGQPMSCPARPTGDEDAGAGRGKIVHRRRDAGVRPVVVGEDQRRETVARQRDRPVLDFGRAVRLRMQPARLLEFQRRFACNAETRAAADRVERMRCRRRQSGSRPVAFGRGLKPFRQEGQRFEKLRVLAPVGDEARQRDERRDEGFGGGDRFFRPRHHWQYAAGGVAHC